MNQSKLWGQIAELVNEADSIEDVLQIGVNLIAGYMEHMDSSDITLKMKNCKIRITIETREPEKVEEKPAEIMH